MELEIGIPPHHWGRDWWTQAELKGDVGPWGGWEKAAPTVQDFQPESFWFFVISMEIFYSVVSMETMMPSLTATFIGGIIKSTWPFTAAQWFSSSAE